MLQKIVHQTVRAAHGDDWTAILVLAELLKRADLSQSHPAIPDTAHVFVAQDEEGHIVGMVACHEIRDGVMPVSNLYVLDQHRRRGVATALLQAALAYADGNEITLTANRSNVAARRIFRKLGFRLSDCVELRLAPCS